MAAWCTRIAGLQDPAIVKAKSDAETALRQRVSADPQLSSAYGDAWQMVDNALNTYRPIYPEFRFLEGGVAFNSHLFGIARTLQRLADESQKPNAERLREYRESNLESLKQDLYSEAPIYDDLESLTLADSLSLKFSRIQFTPDLMPADITGTEVIQEDKSTGAREFRF